MNYKNSLIFTLPILLGFMILSVYKSNKLKEAEDQRDIWESVHKVDRVHIDHLNKDLEESKYWEKFTANELAKCHDKKLKIDKNGKSKIYGNTNNN